MARTDAGTHTPESLLTVAAALQAMASRLTRVAESMKEKGVASLEIKNQSGLKAGVAGLRGFGMAAEGAYEEWVFDQHMFRDEEPAEGEAARPREAAPRKARKTPAAESKAEPAAE